MEKKDKLYSNHMNCYLTSLYIQKASCEEDINSLVRGIDLSKKKIKNDREQLSIIEKRIRVAKSELEDYLNGMETETKTEI